MELAGALSIPAARKNALPPIEKPGEQSPPPSESSPLERPSTDGSLNSVREGTRDGSAPPSARTSARTFKAVGTAIKLSLMAAQGFSTLRDMGGASDVRPADLRTVRRLGEGAFAVVEEALYAPAPAPPTSPPPSAPLPLLPSAPLSGPLPQSARHQSVDGGRGPNGGRAAAAAAAASAAPRRVAVKRLKPEIVNHQGDLAAFMAEVALLRKLAHKRVVEFIGVGSTDTASEEAKRRTMFLVQEFMDGGTLKQLLSRQMVDVGRHVYSYEDAFRWALHVAEGLDYLHSSRPVVIHRDLKLENILLKGTDPHTADAKIADFGLVALVRPRDRSLHEALQAQGQADGAPPQGQGQGQGQGRGQLQLQRSVSRALSRLVSSGRRPEGRAAAGAAMSPQEAWDQSFKVNQLARVRALPPQQLSGRTGSYMYMAPEVYRQEAYSEKVDVFSFGVIVFELLSRYQMVCAVSLAGTEDEIESYADKVSRGYRPPLPSKWPQPLRDLIAACWAQDPAQRPSMAAVRQSLQRMAAEGVPGEMQRLCQPPLCACTIC